MKAEYYEGSKAREKFEKTMVALFEVKKSELKEKPKPPALKKKAGKG